MMAAAAMQVSTIEAMERRVVCYLRHMKTPMGQFNHVLAIGTLLPLSAFRNVHEKLHVWIGWTKSTMCFALAMNACLLLAVLENATPHTIQDILWPNKLGAFSV